MSLTIHLSTQSATLLAKLLPALAQARAGSLVATAVIPHPVPVLVPSAQFGDWLQARLARDLGLSMGFEFLPPSEYFSRHFANTPATARFAAASAFWAATRLRWQLLPFVDTVAHRLGQNPAKALGPRDRFAFACLLARQFDLYARFRPDWPERWASNQPAWDDDQPNGAALSDDEAWQRELWRAVANQDGAPAHPARMLTQIEAATITPPSAPLFFVGSNILDPMLLRTLQMVGQQGHHVSLHLLLPSLGYLGDVPRRRSVRARYAENSDAAAEIGGHPLISSLGQQAVGTFLLLDSVSPDYDEWPEFQATVVAAPAGLPLLQRLQSDIRDQRPPCGPSLTSGSGEDQRPQLNADDRTLQIHCCHSPRRELEVLRDELLRAFADLPNLKPDEVMVAVTDFDAYAPLAEGILRAGPQPLPVRLTAIPAREANPIAVALLALLRTSLGRHSASELVEILNLSAIQHHLELAGEADVLAQLAESIRQSGLTHGIDSADQGAGGDTGTWRVAIDRLLAGAWFGPVVEAKDAGGTFVHAIAADLHHHDDALLRFISWLTRLALQLKAWQEAAPAADWAARLQQTVDDLLASEEMDDHAAAMGRMLGELASVEAKTPLDAGAMLDWLEPQLENATSLRTSMGGEILFGRLDQLHGLPCRVLAILGLQDGTFPRAGRRPAWDLLKQRPRHWDADPRTQDRQWFLDALLTPSDRLILSAANRSLRTPHDGPLSSCVEELLRAATATVRPAVGCDSLEAQIVVRHRIQPFAADYFHGGGLPRSFDAGSARIAGDLAGPGKEETRPFYCPSEKASATSAADALTLTIPQLVAFWKEPARAWLKAMQLDMAGEEVDDTALDDSPLNLDNLQAYQVRAAALETHLGGGPNAAASERLVADRTLPPGALGALAWDVCDQEVALLARGLAPLLAQARPLPLDLTMDGQARLTGSVTLTKAAGTGESVLVYRTSKYDGNPRHQLEAFVHLLAATVGLRRPVTCTVLGLDLPAPKVLPGLPLEEATARLRKLVEGFQLGQKRPLCYAPATSAEIAGVLGSDGNDDAALERGEGSWSREPFNGQPGGEGTTPAAMLAWRDNDPFAAPHGREWLRWTREFALPMQAWWEGNDEAAAAPKSTSRRKA